MIWAMTPPIDAPITCARVDALGVEDRQRVARHLVEVVRTGRLARPADAAVVGSEAAVAPPERHALERPAARVGARGPGS